MKALRTIAIIGGGFAGTTLARALDGKLPSGHKLLLIGEESHTTFASVLPEGVGVAAFPEQIVAPIRQMVRQVRFVMGRVTNILQRVLLALSSTSPQRSTAASACRFVVVSLENSSRGLAR